MVHAVSRGCAGATVLARAPKHWLQRFRLGLDLQKWSTPQNVHHFTVSSCRLIASVEHLEMWPQDWGGEKKEEEK